MECISTDSKNNQASAENVFATPQADLVNHADQPTKDRLFSIRGRISRLTYWARCGYGFILLLLAIVPVILFIEEFAVNTLEFKVKAVLLVVAAVLVGIASIVLIFVATIKRLHDLDKSGWLLLVAVLPVVGVIYSVYICVASGSSEPNRFGAQRPNGRIDSVFGWLGLVLIMVMLIASGYDTWVQISAYFQAS